MSSSSSSHRIVTCPACKGDSVYGPDNRFRPFCSERCKNVDLGAWASESYRLKAKPSTSEDDVDGAAGASESH